MIYEKFRPCQLLQPYVECYFVWRSATAITETLIVESPPTGFCSIVLNSGDPYHLQNKKYDYLLVPNQFVCGQAIYSYKLFLKGNISLAGVVLKPTALASLFLLPTFEYTEERIPLTSVFKASIINTLSKEIETATGANDKVKLLEEFVLKYYYNSKPKPDAIDYAANTILVKNGLIHINDLLKDVFMSRRNFERRFFKKVGVSPKYYARIRRMSYLLNLIAGKKKVDWPTIFGECAFYDQSHFIKDFIEFTGRSPQQYLEENAELANLIEKPTTNNIAH